MMAVLRLMFCITSAALLGVKPTTVGTAITVVVEVVGGGGSVDEVEDDEHPANIKVAIASEMASQGRLHRGSMATSL